MKVLHEHNLITTAGGLWIARSSLASNPKFLTTPVEMDDYSDTALELALYPMRDTVLGGYTMPGAILRTLLANANNIHVNVEALPGVETAFRKLGYDTAVTELLDEINNWANASRAYVNVWKRGMRHRFSLGLMARTDGSLHWLFNDGATGNWCDPAATRNNHTFKVQTAFASGRGFPAGLTIYVYG